MASIVLGAAGAALGGGFGTALGTAGGAIGAGIGTFLDQKVIFPHIFPVASTARQSLDLPRSQANTDGGDANICIGRRAKCYGQIRWLGERIQTETKGQFFFHQAIGVLICKNEITNIIEVTAQGETIFKDISLDSGTTGLLSYSRAPDGNSTYLFLDRTVFADLKVSRNTQLTISGATTHTSLNADHNVLRTFGSDDNSVVTVIIDHVDATIPISPASTDTVTITLEFFSNKVLNSVDAMHEYLGTAVQTADSTISGVETDVPAFRHSAYVVFERFDLSKFGGIPPVFSFVVEENATRTLGEAIGQILELGGLTSSDYDVTGLTEAFDGITIQGIQPLKSVIEPILTAYDLNLVEENATLKFVKRGGETPITVTEADISVRESGDSSIPRKAGFQDGADVDLPRYLTVSFIDPDLDFQQGTVGRPRDTTAFNGAATVNLPLVLDRDDAISLQKKLHSRILHERVGISISLPWKYIHSSPGDVMTITLDSETYTVRVEEITRGNNFTLQVSGVVINSDTSAEPSTVDSLENFVTQTPDGIQTINTEVLQIPAVFDEDVLNPVIYFGCYELGLSDSNFRGAVAYVSHDQTNYVERQRTAQDNVIGHATTALATTTNFFTFDYTNTVRVEVHSGTLQSLTEARVTQERENMALLGTEIIYFVTATLVSANTYDLTGLLRGVRNTESEAGTHAVDERFVLLNGEDQDDITKLPLSFSDINKSLYVDIVAVGDQAGNDTAASAITIDLKTNKPFSPTDAIFTNDGTDVTITWKRRSRAFGAELKDGGTPLVDDVELYVIELLDDGASTVSATKETTTATVTFTNAEMTTAGYTPIEDITVNIYQKSPIYGLGNVEQATGS